MLRNLWYHRVMFSVKVSVSAGSTCCATCLWCARRWGRPASWPPPLLSLIAETVAESPHFSSCLCRGNWVCLLVCRGVWQRDGERRRLDWQSESRQIFCNEYKWAPGLSLLIWLTFLKAGSVGWNWPSLLLLSFLLGFTALFRTHTVLVFFFLLSANHAEVFKVAF